MMTEKVPKYLISDEQLAWMKEHTAMVNAVKMLSKQFPRNVGDAVFMKSLLNEITNQRKILFENLPKDRVKELHNQPDPKDIDAYKIGY